MKVSVIIINYNTFNLTSNCIRSVIKETKAVDYEIILVDNASSECNPDRFLEEFPMIKLVKSDINGGFAKGNNLGIVNASGEMILLLNSDTILTEDSIGRCALLLKDSPDTGAVGCRMIYPNGGIQYTARKFRSIGWELLDLVRIIPFLMPYPMRSRIMLGKYFRHDEDKEADWLNGAFFLFPSAILKELPSGKLDERFFMYGEDQLWCEQIKNLGYKRKFYAGTTIIHINSGSTSLEKQLSLRKTMMRHELAIMEYRKGKGVYYFFFFIIYTAKEKTRNFLKFVFYKITGRLIK